MADYYSPTVVQQPIPVTDLTPLEHLVLSLVFDAEFDGDAIWFHSDIGPSDSIGMSIDDLQAAFQALQGIRSAIAVLVGECLAAAPPDDTDIDIDLSVVSWALMLQDIVRRSPTLDYLTVVTAFTCSKMRVDGFGGMALLITADTIRCKSTHDILEEFLAARDVNRSA